MQRLYDLFKIKTNMGYAIIQPAQELKGHVNYFWLSRPIGLKSAMYYATANTRTELVFAFKEASDQSAELLCSLIEGQTHRFGQYPAQNFGTLLGVSLRLSAISPFFKLSPAELNHQFIDLETLLGQEGRCLNETIAHAPTTEKRIQILTSYFKSKLNHEQVEDQQMLQAMEQLKKHRGVVNIKALASQFYLSPKQFERRFKAFTGFNPKLYARVIRFEAVLKHHHQYSSLTEAALEHGYYDQAHFNADFKQFSGFSPKQFFTLTGN